MPPIAGAASPTTPMTAALAGGPQMPGQGMQQEAAGLEAVMGQIRDLDQSAQAIEADFPQLAPHVQQLKQILKRMVIDVASAAPQQTMSSAAVPMGGGPQ